ncbi:hypothetical protein FBY50_1037 [Zymomonas mobilis]|nr:hypothetical protein B9T50_04930 [Zymomonas mobilis subsp. mobilis]TWD60221.1 hypothetical protein FBY50_1037 [Zymomonas mobilis]
MRYIVRKRKVQRSIQPVDSYMTETPTDDAEGNDSLTPQILKAQKQVEEAKQRYKSLLARQAAAKKKHAEARRKILGDLLIKAAEKDERYNRVIKVLMDSHPQVKTNKAFVDWEVPHPDHP